MPNENLTALLKHMMEQDVVCLEDAADYLEIEVDDPAYLLLDECRFSIGGSDTTNGSAAAGDSLGCYCVTELALLADIIEMFRWPVDDSAFMSPYLDEHCSVLEKEFKVGQGFYIHRRATAENEQAKQALAELIKEF